MQKSIIIRAVVVIVLLYNAEGNKPKGSCVISNGFQGQFTIRDTTSGTSLGTMSVDASTLNVNYNSKKYNYVCKGHGDRNDVILFQLTDSSTTPKFLCLQFTHIADHPFAQLALRRYSKFPEYDKDFFSPLPETTTGATVCALPDPHNPVEVYLQ